MGRQIIAKWIRDMLPKRCANCGDTKNLTYHHIVPVSRGGNDVPSNIAVLCPTCHAKADFEKRGAIGHGVLVREGIERARLAGVHIGKKAADYEKVMRMIAEHSTQFNLFSETTEGEIMRMAGVKNTLYAKCKRMLLEAMQADVWPYAWKKPKQVRSRPMYEHQIERLRGY